MLDNNLFFPQVLQAVPTDDYKVYAYFNDGSIHLFDMKPLILEDTVFAILSDINIFKETITIINDTVAWDLQSRIDYIGKRNSYECIDIDPFTVYQSQKVSDPLE